MASYEETLVSISLPADTSIATWTGVANYPGTNVANPNGNQYRFVTVNSSGKVVLATNTSTTLVGVLQSIPQVAGQAATVGIEGVTMVELSGTLAAGDPVWPGAAGTAVKVSAGGGLPYAGILLQGGAIGEVVPCLLRSGYLK